MLPSDLRRWSSAGYHQQVIISWSTSADQHQVIIIRWSLADHQQGTWSIQVCWERKTTQKGISDPFTNSLMLSSEKDCWCCQGVKCWSPWQTEPVPVPVPVPDRLDGFPARLRFTKLHLNKRVVHQRCFSSFRITFTVISKRPLSFSKALRRSHFLNKCHQSVIRLF